MFDLTQGLIPVLGGFGVLFWLLYRLFWKSDDRICVISDTHSDDTACSCSRCIGIRREFQEGLGRVHKAMKEMPLNLPELLPGYVWRFFLHPRVRSVCMVQVVDLQSDSDEPVIESPVLIGDQENVEALCVDTAWVLWEDEGYKITGEPSPAEKKLGRLKGDLPGGTIY